MEILIGSLEPAFYQTFMNTVLGCHMLYFIKFFISSSLQVEQLKVKYDTVSTTRRICQVFISPILLISDINSNFWLKIQNFI